MNELWELPRGWHWATMGDVARVVGGSTPKTSEPSYWGGDIPWITPDDLSGFTGKYIEQGRRNISRAGYDSCSTQLVPAGTVLFTSRAPIGYTAIAANPVCTNQGFKSFVPGPAVIPDYIYWWLKASKDLATSLASGTTFLELSGKAAARLPVPVPPLDDQKRIVAALEQQLTRLEASQRSLSSAQRHSLSLAVATLDQAWRSQPDKAFMSLADVARDSDYGTSQKASFDAVGWPILRIPNVVEGRLKLQDLKFATRPDELRRDRALRPGDFLVVRTNGSRDLIGRGAVVESDFDRPHFHASYLIRFRLTGGPLLWRWLSLIWQAPALRRQLESMAATSAGQYNLNLRSLARLLVPIPSDDLLTELVPDLEGRLSAASELRLEIGRSLKRATRLRASILSQAFSGYVS
jgi:type I restriction enzyme S subunit